MSFVDTGDVYHMNHVIFWDTRQAGDCGSFYLKRPTLIMNNYEYF